MREDNWGTYCTPSSTPMWVFSPRERHCKCLSHNPLGRCWPPFLSYFWTLRNKLTLLFITTKIYNSSFSLHSANSLRCGFFRPLLFLLDCPLQDATGHWFLLHGPGRPRCLKNIYLINTWTSETILNLFLFLSIFGLYFPLYSRIAWVGAVSVPLMPLV